jgi:signal transduction histidine kinase
MALCGIAGCRGEPHFTDEAAAFDLHADQHRLGQLLQTLIQHAVHRDPDHLADIGLAVVSGHLHIRIVDHGAPLDADARDTLLSRPQAKPYDGGLGLRLLLARRIAEAHGGSLSIGDTTGGGLSLVCALPARPGL